MHWSDSAYWARLKKGDPRKGSFFSCLVFKRAPPSLRVAPQLRPVLDPVSPPLPKRPLSWGGRLLVALWVLSASLTGLEVVGLLNFAYPAVAALVRLLTWLLVFGVDADLGTNRGLIRLLWWPLLGSLLLGIVTFFWGGFYVFGFLFIFFGGGNTYWHSTQVLTRDGAWLYVTQQSIDLPMHQGIDKREVVLIPVANWFYLLLPPTTFAVTSWTPVNRPAVYFLADSSQQLQQDHALQQERRCTARLRVLDSLDRANRLPPAVLPALTQHGANTVGCLVQGKVWRNQLGPDSLGACLQPPGSACLVVREPGLPGTQLRIIAQRGMSQQLYLYLPYPLPRVPGVWPLHAKLWVYEPITRTYTQWESRPASVRLILTALDSTRQVVAGTFNGMLYAVDPRSARQRRTLSLGQGRFDCVYSTWVEN